LTASAELVPQTLYTAWY